MPPSIPNTLRKPPLLSQKTCDKVFRSLKRNDYENFTVVVVGNGFEIQVGGKDFAADDLANQIDNI